MNPNEEYVQIKPQYFLHGMYVDSDIYYIQANKPVLFCKSSIITEEKIRKLREIADLNAPIYIQKATYHILMQQYESMNKTHTAMEQRCRGAQKEFGKRVQQAKFTNKVDVAEMKKISDVLEDTVDQVELSHLIQWISYMRDNDEYLCTHSVNVGVLSGLIGKWLGYEPEKEKKLVLTGLLHDIGKTKIDDRIINKPGRLTSEEFTEIKKHPLHTYKILKNSGIEDEEILSGAMGHHEKGNGSGYPDGLSIDKISTFARIISIADIYDAMVAKRTYKDAQSPFVVLDEFYRNKFSDLDIRLVDIFLEHMAGEMIGKQTILSDGRMAEVVFIEKSNFLYPMVKCNGEVINTSPNLRCETLCMDL